MPTTDATNPKNSKDASITFTLDGTAIHARPGQSIGAALIEAGITSWRTTRIDSRPRGMFCGIGMCFDCLLTVDGVPNQRACLVPARDGAHCRTQEHT